VEQTLALVAPHRVADVNSTIQSWWVTQGLLCRQQCNVSLAATRLLSRVKLLLPRCRIQRWHKLSALCNHFYVLTQWETSPPLRWCCLAGGRRSKIRPIRTKCHPFTWLFLYSSPGHSQNYRFPEYEDYLSPKCGAVRWGFTPPCPVDSRTILDLCIPGYFSLPQRGWTQQLAYANVFTLI